ncbi:BMP family ABC transporter substrate-binding protein [Alteribacter natronophilus]|uniref:BMP family ABC transporter substrate-binding protein n=1 Tax=Alteribacter natronophilus TaxID=2583810 RepID=UPI00110E19E8|nr:BMP family ABC transporter substrate-binding protein [Alteribacter natronophilus]TMW71469.1 BMP family ABC transporter substrate-binding protein [Alteribacter natronophilus]
MKQGTVVFCVIILAFLTGCTISAESGELEKAGLLLPYTYDDEGWNRKGYQGLLHVHASMDVDVYVEEDIRTTEAVREAVQRFADEGVNLVFGHSTIYAEPIMEISGDFPDLHFISVNGEVSGENITGLHFQGYAMGYFAGMLAGKMSDTGTVAVIGAEEWQPEAAGFADGALFAADNMKVHTGFTGSWIDEEAALKLHKEFKDAGADVFYPAGDGFHVAIVEQVKADHDYAIGYVGDQLDLGEATVLTSTVQEVERLYRRVAEKFDAGELDSGNRYYDFTEGLVSLGDYGRDVPEDLRKWLDGYVEIYEETGKLPFEIEE